MSIVPALVSIFTVLVIQFSRVALRMTTSVTGRSGKRPALIGVGTTLIWSTTSMPAITLPNTA
jgi:hypothetical protein